MRFVGEVLLAALLLLNQMSPYLLLGLVAAGIVRCFLRPGAVARHLGGRGFKSVFKATLFGIPLPLCSCGVLPAATALHREGASKGAVLAFLISTPATGIDSILATWGMLGGIFALFRVLFAFIAGLLGGIGTNLLSPSSSKIQEVASILPSASVQGFGPRLREVVHYSFRILLKDSGNWLLLGIILGGLITRVVPMGMLQNYLGKGIFPMLAMFIIGVPMYICSAGSLPIAASLIYKGLSPGAALVFLASGPVTNTAGLLVIVRQMGKSSALIMLVVVLLCSVALGGALNYFGDLGGGSFPGLLRVEHGVRIGWLNWVSSAILIGGILLNLTLDLRLKKSRRQVKSQD